MNCPCGSGHDYERCCEPLHLGEPAPTAERLMRSRFSAFALGLPDYLLSSWHRSSRPGSLDIDGGLTWQRLFIESVVDGGPFHETGEVTFTAIARGEEGRIVMREQSRFVRESTRWYYVDGVQL